MSKLEWIGVLLSLAFVALIIFAACSAPSYVAPAADAQLAADAELIYHNPGPRPVRVIKVGDCYITQIVEERGATWLVLDRGGLLGTEASIDCTSGQAPVLP